MENKIKVFENRQVRTLWNAEEEEWYFSVIDVVAVLTNSTNPRKYWSVLKTRFRSVSFYLPNSFSVHTETKALFKIQYFLRVLLLKPGSSTAS